MIQVNRRNKSPLPFSKQFHGNRIDRERVAKLLRELPGIFDWAGLEGARRLYTQRGFTRCQICEACALSHRINSDVSCKFQEDHLRLDPNSQIRCNLLYNAYVNYCGQNGRVPVNSSSWRQRRAGAARRDAGPRVHWGRKNVLSQCGPGRCQRPIQRTSGRQIVSIQPGRGRRAVIGRHSKNGSIVSVSPIRHWGYDTFGIPSHQSVHPGSYIYRGSI